MDHFTYRAGSLFAEEVDCASIAAAHGTPTYVYSTATLRRHARLFPAGLADVPHKICYAVKANGNPALLRVLAEEGLGADVVSEGEIRLALAGGIKPADIVFSGVGKTREEIAFALTTGIFQFNVESEPELRALSEVATSLGKEAAIALRVNPDVEALTHAKISTGHKASKFGIALARAAEVYDLAATLPGIRVQGVSVHIGSQLTQAAPFAEAFARVVAFVGELRARGHALSVLDLGGGLGIPYQDGQTTLAPEAYIALARDAAKQAGCLLVLEPGRLIAGNAGLLLARVIYVKEEEGTRYLILDAGMNDLVRPAMYDAHHDIVPLRQPAADAAWSPTEIVGPVCESSDVFASARPMPTLAEGDLVAIRSAGAYGASMANNYNARKLPAEVLVDGKVMKVVRSRQSYADIIPA